MIKRFVAQKLIERLDKAIHGKLDLHETMILGVVLKGLPVAYSLARKNAAVANFVPLVAQRHIYMQHRVESYFPSIEWKTHFRKQLSRCSDLLIVDDVVNTGFTRQKVESIMRSLEPKMKTGLLQRFSALILNGRSLANPSFVNPNDFYALKVNATTVECDWGLITVPLWDLPIERALKRCEEYHQRFWQNEKRWITITY